MGTLRLRRADDDASDGSTVVIDYDDGTVRLHARRHIGAVLTDRDYEDIRWYFEDYPRYPFAPAPTRAAEIEGRLRAAGEQLFAALIPDSDDHERTIPLESPADDRLLLDQLRHRLSDIQIVVDDRLCLPQLPWELLRDAAAGRQLVLEASSFVYETSMGGSPPEQEPRTSVARVLLVISRPRAGKDVPFLSVASLLIRQDVRRGGRFRFDTLRPPTFARLGEVLQAAHDRGSPYDIVHFDGHGIYQTVAGGSGPVGFLVFEDPSQYLNEEYVTGRELGAMLARSGVRLLVMNACRSGAGGGSAADHDDPERSHSIAADVIRAGVSAVVAMRYDVYVDSASVFMGELYAHLGSGPELGEAVRDARQALMARRHSGAGSEVVVDDWSVPLVLRSAPIHLVRRLDTATPLPAAPSLGASSRDLPSTGVVGRDDLLLRLDRLLDSSGTVLLWGAGGIGKTVVSNGFRYWYEATSGAELVMRTAFTSRRTARSLLEELEAELVARHAPPRVDGPRSTDAAADGDVRAAAASIVARVGSLRVLWVWEDVDSIEGTGATRPSLYSQLERDELTELRQILVEAGIKVLMTSRQPLEPPTSATMLAVPVMRMAHQPSVILVGLLTRAAGWPVREYATVHPLVQFANGVPLMLTWAVEHVARSGLTTPAEVERLVADLRSGMVAPNDRAGRLEQLRADLARALARLSPAQRRLAAMLYLFRDTVFDGALAGLYDPDHDHFPIAPTQALTAELADAGILLPAAEATKRQSIPFPFHYIHPAAIPILKADFDQLVGSTDHAKRKAERAYVEAIGASADTMFSNDESFPDPVMAVYGLLEPNLWHAWALARQKGWWDIATGPTQGLRNLLRRAGRRKEWEAVVLELTAEYVDPATGGPREGREFKWGLVIQCGVEVAEDRGDQEAAAGILHKAMPWFKRLAEEGLDHLAAHGSVSDLSPTASFHLRNYAIAVMHLLALQDDSSPQRLSLLKDVRRIADFLGDDELLWTATNNLAALYLAAGRLNEAETLARQGLVRTEVATVRAHLLQLLAQVLLERHYREEDETEKATVHEAIKYLRRCIAAAPQSRDDILGNANLNLANALDDSGRPDLAFSSYQEALKHFNRDGDLFGSAKVKDNMSIMLERRGDAKEALRYAMEAFSEYQRVGPRAAHLANKAFWRIDKLGVPYLDAIVDLFGKGEQS